MDWITYMLITGDGCFGIVAVILAAILFGTPAILSGVSDKVSELLNKDDEQTDFTHPSSG